MVKKLFAKYGEDLKYIPLLLYFSMIFWFTWDNLMYPSDHKLSLLHLPIGVIGALLFLLFVRKLERYMKKAFEGK